MHRLLRYIFIIVCLLASGMISSRSYAQCNAVIGASPFPISGCEILTVQFNDNSAQGTVQQRTWNFGDGSPTIGTQNPIHSYNAGLGDTLYVVTLTVQCINGSSDIVTDTVRVYSKPKVNFTANKTTVCALVDSVCFTNTSSSGVGTTYSWNFGDNTTSTQANPCHKYTTGGTYDITLTVSNARGCQKLLTLQNYITVIPAPNPDFIISPFTGCAPLNVTLTNKTDTITNPIASWSWDFGDSSPLATTFNPGSHNYPTVGIYSVTLGATNTLGCSNRTTQLLIVNQTPVINLTTSKGTLCAGETATITLSGTGLGTAQFTWDFNGGVAIPGTGVGPHTLYWANGGVKTVSVTADNNGCKTTASVQVVVYPTPPVQLTVANDTACVGIPLVFTADPNFYPSYNFYVNGVLKQDSAANTYSSPSINNGDIVSVVVTDHYGCNSKGNDSIRVTLFPKPVVTITATPNGTICRGDSIIISATPSTYSQYDFFNGNTLVQSGTSNKWTYKNPVNGQHTIRVIPHQNGCMGSDSAIVTVVVKDSLAKPQVNCGTTTPNSIQFTWNAVTGATGYQVSVNAGGYTTPSSGATGTSHLINGLNSGDSATIVVQALGGMPCGNSLPSDTVKCYAMQCNAITFNYTPSYTACKGSSVTLDISNVSVANYSTSWAGLSPGKSLTYSFTPANDTTIALIVKDSTSSLACPPAMVIFDIKVVPVPAVTLAATEDSICANMPITFTATPGIYDTYTFYDGPQLLQSGFSNTFTATNWVSNHSVTVIASFKNCSSTVSNTWNVTIIKSLQPPIVNCGTTTTNSIEFTWNAVAGATGYLVSINGGANSIPSSGNNGVIHSVTGLSPDTSLTIIVTAIGPGPCGNSAVSLPASCFTLPCVATTFNLTSSQTICNGDSLTVDVTGISATNFDISWNGGTPGTVTSMIFKPVQTTVVSVKLTNLDQPVCPAPVKYTVITVTPKPVVTVTASEDTICEGDQVVFTALPVGYSSYAFYDGFLLLQNTANNVYTSTSWINGHRITCVPVFNGCSGDTGSPVKITVIPKLNVPQVNCGTSSNSTIQFTWDTIPDATGYLVSINGGAFMIPSSGSTGLQHTITGLNQGDSARISVVAVGSNPCGNSAASAPVVCYATPCMAVTFDISPYQTICKGDTITLEVKNISAVNYSISWNNGAPTSVTTFTINPGATGPIPVSVTDNNQASCKPAKKNFVITVKPEPTTVLTSTAVNDSLCEGIAITFNANPAGYDNYSFYNGATLLQTSANPAYTTTNLSAGSLIYVKTLNRSCASRSGDKTITLVAAPVVTLTSSDPNDTICFGESITFTGSPVGLTNYTFNNGTQSLQSSSSQALTTTTLGIGSSNIITVTGTNANGCKASSSAKKIVVLSLPTVTLSSSGGNQICKDQQIIFTAAPAGLANYIFYNGGGQVQSSSANTWVSNQLVTGDTVKVKASGTNGCLSNASADIIFTVKPSAKPTASDSMVGVCRGSSAVLTATVDPQFTPVVYSWSNGATTATTNVNPTTTTMYYVATLYAGCQSAKDSVQVIVDNVPPPVIVVSNDTTICRGDSIQVKASGGVRYTWEPLAAFNNASIAAPKAAPRVTTTYTVTGINTYCETEEEITIYIDKCLTDLTEPTPEVITPNNDGSNDTWVITDIDYFTKSKLVIFNRWGQVVFEAAPYLNTFIGKNSSGQDLTDGTYFYALDLGNDKPVKKGFLIIHR